MITRKAEATLHRLAKGFPVLVITGPRQSGKTTLARAAFPAKPYLSLEDPDIREMAESDPRRLLQSFPDGAILDEAQRAPQLFSYLQTTVDENIKPGMFILTGSQQFGMLSGITQSLAGRAGMLQLLPFSIAELREVGKLPTTVDRLLSDGFYPPLYDRTITPEDWFPSYVTTYIERDVRQLVNIRDLSLFQRFIRMCAARTGQLLNLSALANDCGITHNTAAAWLSVLEASYLLYLLRPHHRNFNKRLVKMPKLYFYDAGLAAWLLGIRRPEEIAFHAQRGNLFETMVVAEFLKSSWHGGRPSSLSFWRDSKGLEIDLIVEQGSDLTPVEIKSGATIASDYLVNIRKWQSLSGDAEHPAWLIYGGDQRLASGSVEIKSWKTADFDEILMGKILPG